MSIKKCLAEIEKAVGEKLTDTQLEDLAEEVERLIKRTRAGNPADLEAAILKATDDFTQSMVAASIIEKRNAILNKRKQIEMLDYVAGTWKGREWDGINAVLAGSERMRKGGRYGVSQSQASLANAYIQGMLTRIDQAGLRREFASGQFDREIFVAMHELDVPNSPKLQDLPKEAVTLAKILAEYNEAARIDANLAGAWIKKIPGYVIKQTHDQYKIRAAGDKEWLADMGKWLDFEESLKDVVDPMATLRNLYTQFSNGVHLHVGQSGPASAFKGFANIGKKLSHERVLHFKSPEAAFEYNQKYGVGSLSDGMIYGLERMAQSTALMRHLGPNAEMNLDAVISDLAKRVGQRGGRDLGEFQQKVKWTKRALWPNITGESRVAANHTLAKVSAGVRAWEQMTKLGGAILSSVMDIPLSGLEARYQGAGMLRGMAEAMGSLFEGRTSMEKQELIAELGVLYDGMRAHALARFDVSDPIPGQLAKMNQIYFGLNGLRPWTDRLRTRLALGLSHRLSVYADRPLSDVSPELRRVLSLYGIDEGKWDLVRAGTEKAVDGRRYVTPEGLDDVEDAAFGPYLEARGTKATPARIRDLRIEIKDQFRAMFNDRATAGILEPNAKTRAWLLQGTQPGTLTGEVFRHVMLFKSFPTVGVQRVLGREIYGRGSDTLVGALKNGHGELLGLAHLFWTGLVFGYLGMSLKDLSKGKEPRPLDNHKTWLAAMAQGGSLGIYGDFLFGETKNRFGGGLVSTLAGPTAGAIEDIADLYGRFRDGDDTAAQAVRFTINNGPTAPLTNLFYTRWAFDYLIGYRIQEAMNPGSLRRMEKRLRREKEQEFIVSPSSVIPHGG